MALERSNDLELLCIVNLRQASVRANSKVVASLAPAHRRDCIVSIQLTKLLDLRSLCRPYVHGIHEAYR